jgi:hypothetical protein
VFSGIARHVLPDWIEEQLVVTSPPSFADRPPFPGLGKAGINVLRAILWRMRTRGIRSGLVCAQAYVMNGMVKVRNRIARKPRVFCVCCGWSGSVFRAYDIGRHVVPNHECPACGSNDRQRFFHRYMEEHGFDSLQAGKRVLHCAPEPHVRTLIHQSGARRMTMDINFNAVAREEDPRVNGNLTAIPLTGNAFDGIVLLHVLEHIADDRAAFHELARILRPGGQAIIMVPVYPGLTEIDDWGYPDPNMFDHYRTYCDKDFHLRCEPLDVEIIHPKDVLSPEEQQRHAIRDSEIIFVCRPRK